MPHNQQAQVEMNIDEMLAGRELDTLVGWHIFKKCAGGDARHLPVCAQECSECSLEHSFGYEHPYYSTRSAAAWRVVEKLLATPGDTPYDFACAICGGAPEPIEGIYLQQWDGEDVVFFVLRAIKNLTPLAICQAALEAVNNAT